MTLVCVCVMLCLMCVMGACGRGCGHAVVCVRCREQRVPTEGEHFVRERDEVRERMVYVAADGRAL